MLQINFIICTFTKVCSGGISENLSPEVNKLSIHTSLFDIVVSIELYFKEWLD